MNHPFPSNAQLRAEEIAHLLIEEQQEAADKFKAALVILAATLDCLHFPLGCPTIGYDRCQIDAIIAEWMVHRTDYADAAADAARMF